MNIDTQIVGHPCFCDNDYKYQKGRGKTDAEILDIWDRALRRGRGPVIHDGGITRLAI